MSKEPKMSDKDKKEVDGFMNEMKTPLDATRIITGMGLMLGALSKRIIKCFDNTDLDEITAAIRSGKELTEEQRVIVDKKANVVNEVMSIAKGVLGSDPITLIKKCKQIADESVERKFPGTLEKNKKFMDDATDDEDWEDVSGGKEPEGIRYNGEGNA